MAQLHLKAYTDEEEIKTTDFADYADENGLFVYGRKAEAVSRIISHSLFP